MSTYSDDMRRVGGQLMMCEGIIEKCASKLDSLQTEAQELIALVGQEDEDKLKALVQALAQISEAKADAIGAIQPIGEARQVVERYMDGL